MLTLQQKEADAVLDLEYVQLNVPKVLALFNKVRPVCMPAVAFAHAHAYTALLETQMIAVNVAHWGSRFRPAGRRNGSIIMSA